MFELKGTVVMESRPGYVKVTWVERGSPRLHHAILPTDILVEVVAETIVSLEQPAAKTKVDQPSTES